MPWLQQIAINRATAKILKPRQGYALRPFLVVILIENRCKLTIVFTFHSSEFSMLQSLRRQFKNKPFSKL